MKITKYRLMLFGSLLAIVIVFIIAANMARKNNTSDLLPIFGMDDSTLKPPVVHDFNLVNQLGVNITQNDVKLNTTASLQEINDLFPNGTKITSRQETSFIEVPVEAYYIFSDKKFGMATAFGASFLKFQNNDLYLENFFLGQTLLAVFGLAVTMGLAPAARESTRKS